MPAYDRAETVRPRSMRTLQMKTWGMTDMPRTASDIQTLGTSPEKEGQAKTQSYKGMLGHQRGHLHPLEKTHVRRVCGIERPESDWRAWVTKGPISVKIQRSFKLETTGVGFYVTS